MRPHSGDGHGAEPACTPLPWGILSFSREVQFYSSSMAQSVLLYSSMTSRKKQEWERKSFSFKELPKTPGSSCDKQRFLKTLWSSSCTGKQPSVFLKCREMQKEDPLPEVKATRR